MTTRVILTGATGWVGRALVPAIVHARDLALVGAVARAAAGRDLGEAIGTGRLGVTVSGSLAEALATPADVLIDYTTPDAVKHHVLQALAHGLHVVIGTSGLSADDLARIDTAARAQERGVIAAGNFSITATLLKLFALAAARYIADVEIIDYASPGKPDTADVEPFVDQLDLGAHHAAHEDVANAIIDGILERHPAFLNQPALPAELGRGRRHLPGMGCLVP